MPDGTLNDIEARVARDRAALAQSLDRLSSTVAPERLKAEAQTLGSDLGRQVWHATRENPAAFVLVGAGLALMASGTGRRAETDAHLREPTATPPLEAMEGFDGRVATADAKLRKRAGGRTEVSAHRLRRALDRGLDKLPPAARARVLDARRRAIAAQDAVERRAARLARRAERVATEQPVAVAASAFGVGALLAALLPSTAREDALLGAERDALMDEAGEVLARETEALRRQMGGRDPRTSPSPAEARAGS